MWRLRDGWEFWACMAVAALITVALQACGGGWGKAGQVAVDVGECTLEKLIEQERARGHAVEARRLQSLAGDLAAADAGATDAAADR